MPNCESIRHGRRCGGYASHGFRGDDGVIHPSRCWRHAERGMLYNGPLRIWEPAEDQLSGRFIPRKDLTYMAPNGDTIAVSDEIYLSDPPQFDVLINNTLYTGVRQSDIADWFKLNDMEVPPIFLP